MWQLDRTSSIPFYQQITSEIIQMIQQGQLTAGDKLPPERKLASAYQVNRSTVVRALEELVSLGWIVRRQGSGTLVAEGRWGSRQLLTNPWKPLLTSPFLKDDPYVTELKQLQSAPSALDLYTGDLPTELIPDFAFPSITWEQVRKEEAKISVTGYEPLKKHILAHLHTRAKLPLEGQDLLITSGSTQGIALLMQVLLEQGDQIGTENPSFLFALPLFASLGIHLVGIKQDAEGIEPAALEHIIQTKKIKLLYLNPNFQNPTGSRMSLARRKTILAICQNYQLPVIEDDVFGELSFEQPLPTLKSLAPEQVIYLGSLSKRFGSSIKIGWLFATERLIESLANAKKRMEDETDIFPQLLATAALSAPDYDTQQDKLLTELKRRSAHFEKLANSFHTDWTFHPISGGLYYWLTWKNHELSRKNWRVFLEEELLLAPAFLFSSDTMSVRINYSRLSDAQTFTFEERFARATNKIKKGCLL